MKTRDLIAKYHEVLAKISNANIEGDWQPDMGVALDMLKHECYARHGLFDRTPNYKGVPADFDWEAFEKDIELDKIAKSAKKNESTSKTKVLVNGKIIEVKRVMVNGENFIRLRDFDDVLGICKVDYDKEKNLPIVKRG